MEVCTVGGFEEVGKNMTAVKVGEDVFIFDVGVHLPAIIEMQDEAAKVYSEHDLRKSGAIPNDLVLDKLGWTNKVRAILISHAHLDHVGAVPYLVHRYPDAVIMGSPFTMAVLETIIRDEKIHVKNKRKIVHPNSIHIVKGITEDYKVEFIHTTHSTIQCTFIALHSKDGTFFYALDFKFDNYPTIGNPPNYKRFRELGKKGIKVAVIDSLYAGTEKKPGGEKVAKQLLEEAFHSARSNDTALFVTTFSSHIERLNSIVEFAKKTGRKIVFIGRSLNKYVNAAIEVRQCPFRKSIYMVRYKNQVESMLKKINENRGKYVVVCTGHQAEEGSILDRISKNETHFIFKPGDNLIFSSSVIPVPINLLARERMDKRLRKMGVKIQTDVHVHGHGSREGLRELLDILKPEHIIPAHGTIQMEAPMIDLATEFGYKFGETSHLVSDGKVLKFD